MHYDMKQSGARIRFFRKQNRCTQEELAKLLSMDRSFLSGIESGKKGCSVDLFIQFAEFFHISLDELMFWRCSVNWCKSYWMKEIPLVLHQ